ncbi:MAG: LysR family transcriptional regulator [Verrucomicrobia bacterium]|nr:LysR family transcriptional regulator [Verrucomicrobiota bacterium]
MTPILDSRRLLAFATLARIGSFTLAAKELHLTQSAVSHAIKALEDELGLRLFERRGRRVALTPAGEHLLIRAQRILAEMQDARADLAALVQ